MNIQAPFATAVMAGACLGLGPVCLLTKKAYNIIYYVIYEIVYNIVYEIVYDYAVDFYLSGLDIALS